MKTVKICLYLHINYLLKYYIKLHNYNININPIQNNLV